MKKLLIAFLLLASTSAYAMNESFHPGITRVLAKNGVTVCGDYRWVENWQYKNEFTVHCTRDGKKWTEWTVWVGADKVQFVKELKNYR